jgi:hypothetical protein
MQIGPDDYEDTKTADQLHCRDHITESYEEWRKSFLSSASLTSSAGDLSHFANRQFLESHPGVSDSPLTTMSTTYETYRDASSENESDEEELPHKLVRSQLESVMNRLRTLVQDRC